MVSKVKSRKKSSRKTCFNHQPLSKPQLEVMGMLTNEFLTIKQIATRRRCSKQNIYQIITKLKQKGFLKQSYLTLEKKQPTLTKVKQIRLHGQEFNIKILYKDQRYKKLLNKSNLINVDGNTIKLYNNSIEVYSGQSFYGDDVDKVTYKSIGYFNKLFVRLENDFKLVLIKNRCQNIKQVNAHYSEVNNELSEEYEIEGVKLRLYAREDGKLWGTIDNSFNMHEFETLHPKTGKPDMNRVRNVFNDIRDNEHIPLSELSHYVADTTKQINEISHGLKILMGILSPKVPQETGGLNKPDYIQ